MIKPVLFTFFAKFTSALLSLGVAILVSNTLGAEGRGNQALLLANISFAVHLLSILGSEGISILHARNRRYEYLWISYLWAAMFLILFWAFAILWGRMPLYMWHITGLGLLTTITISNMSIFIGDERIRLFNILQLLIPSITAISIAISHFVFRNFSFERYITILYLSYGTVWILSFTGFNTKRLFNFDGFRHRFSHNFRLMFNYGFNNQFAAIVQLAGARGCFYIIGFYYGDGELGYYANAVAITEAVWIISKSFGFIMFSRFINIRKNQLIEKIVRRALSLNLVLLTACFSFLILIPDSLYTALFGKDFSQLKVIIVALLPGSLIYGQYIITSHYFSGTRHHFVNTFSGIIGALVLLLSGAMFIPSAGNMGAVAATTLSYLSMWISHFYFLRKITGINLFEASFKIDAIRLMFRFARKTVILQYKHRN